MRKGGNFGDERVEEETLSLAERSAWANVEHHYQVDNCSPKTSTSKRQSSSIPATWTRNTRKNICPVSSLMCWRELLGAFGKRMGHLFFKQAVDQDLMANLLASDINVGLDTLQKLRVRCVKNVKETNGEIDFQDAFRFQKRIEE